MIVFLPLLAFEVTILADNFRMCKAVLPRDDESVSDDAIWETLPHFWVAISMVFFIAATVFTHLKLCGFVDALGWWDLLIDFGYISFDSFFPSFLYYRFTMSQTRGEPINSSPAFENISAGASLVVVDVIRKGVAA
ncbi:unnamed protein product [Lactuca saligna]|uniref:Uncharacterized protein n=1 Tax=Lactuca saligna TaxID=75948 RepID=A0AA35YMN9_LACSI|nr:unnamed protein product [Lactuca saligna]